MDRESLFKFRCTECIRDLDLTLVRVASLLTTFNINYNFWGSLEITKDWLESKPKLSFDTHDLTEFLLQTRTQFTDIWFQSKLFLVV